MGSSGVRVDRRKKKKRSALARRKAFTMLETLIALAIATLIILTLFNILITGSKTVTHDVDTLEYLGKATVLLEYLKRDIRSASSEENSVSPGSGNVVIRKCDQEGKTVTVTYEYHAEKHFVLRQEEGRRPKAFGQEGDDGIITEFLVKAVDDEKYRGFFQISVAFTPRRRHLAKAKSGTLPIHRFKCLINRRAPDARDDRWNRAFNGG